MSKFLDSRFNKISYLTPSLSSSYITPKTHFSGVESEGRFRRVASYVFGIQNACQASGGISDGPDGPKFDVRARVSPSRSLRLAGGRVLPLPVLASLRSGWSSPSRWAGSGCVSVKGALRPSSQSSPCSPCGLCVAPGCSGRPLTLPHPSKRLRASQSLVDTFKRPSGATGHPNSPRRASTASRRAFWACMVFTSSASVVSRVGASSQPVRL